MKRKPDDLSPQEQKKTRTLLMTAAADAAKNENISDFLEGLLTPSEQIMLGRRIWIARLLLADKSYQEIGAKLHVGPNTVMKVESWLQGTMPHYDTIIQKVETAEKNKKRNQQAWENPFGLTALKKRYPLHFLLFPWPKL